MQRVGWVIAVWVCAVTAGSFGQSVVDSPVISASAAHTWSAGDTRIIQLAGPVTIDLDRTRATATDAVLWINGTSGDDQQAQIALLGNASIKQGSAGRSGQTLFLTATLRGPIKLTAATRSSDDQSRSAVYQRAVALQQANQPKPVNRALPARGQPALPPGPTPSTLPVRPPAKIDVTIARADQINMTRGVDGLIVVTLSGQIQLFVRREAGDSVEMMAERIVLFTNVGKLQEAGDLAPGQTSRGKIQAVYLEGDIRVNYAPPRGSPIAEQRMTADRAYYELATDRAILTDAVFHTIDPKTQIPLVMRADTLRQLAQNQYKGEGIRLTTSTFANPSFAVAAEKAYVRIEATGDERLGNRFTFSANHVKSEFFGVPVFWLPVAGGSVTERGFPLRGVQVGSSNRFGFGVETEWGLAETLGYPPPRDIDVSYRLDYYSERGPAGGLDAKYKGGFITDTTRQAWNFSGELRSYFVFDRGVDDLGASRADIEPSETLRGRARWQHQQFLPEHWQLQLRASYVSDATFMEEWFQREWEDGRPDDLHFYMKRQIDTEALTIQFNYQPNGIVTDAEFVQEQFEVSRLPQIGYHRIGDSFARDRLTFFSNNTAAMLRYVESRRTPEQQGFGPGVSPGLPAVGQTGTTDDPVARGDFRQEINYPLSAGKFRVVPYVLGRMTSYTDTPNAGTQHRLFMGTGVRVGTTFWKTIDNAQSDLLDIHRLRHVVEPELNVFTSAQTVDRNELYWFDQEVDQINDITALSLALRQTWQTKRGGPGRWRNVDVFRFNLVGNFFANEPPDRELEPSDFRGLFFPSLPEASVPRDSINADATWRISDDTVLMGDVQYNLEENTIATAAIGLAVRRDDRLSYTIGNSYIAELDSNITSVGVNYTISRKYSIGYNQSFDFGQGDNVNYTATLTRRFDTFALLFRADYDQYNDDSSVGVSLQPIGARGSIGTDNAFGNR